MEFYVPLTNKELSQRKLEVFEQASKIINWGRRNPVRFAEQMLGYKLIDYQAWTLMECWVTPFCCLVECRAAGKDTFMAVLLPTKMILIPNYKIFVSSNSYPQSADSFKKIEEIALQRFPAFEDANDIFAREVEKSQNSEIGFLHSPHSFKLYNNSELLALSNNIETIRGKRGSVWFNEVGWKTADELAVVENFANIDAGFSTSVSKTKKYNPIHPPLQLLYTSSASDVSYPFYDKYKTFAKKMFLGNRDYFVCDIDANDVLHYSTIDGEKIKSHLTQEKIDKLIEEDPDLADRELFNRFRRGSGENAVVRMETLIQNSTVRNPLLFNDTGKKKFIFCYDPARNFDGSILSIWQVIDNKEIGYKLQVENVISMVDKETTKKTPLPMPEQLKIIKEQLIKYNGERAAEWENIEFYIDAGSGGGGISAVADQLMEDWKDDTGKLHRGIIDPVHMQYQTARSKYPNAAKIVHLIDPQGYKKVIYNALEKMTKLNLMNFTEYDNKEYILLENAKSELDEYYLSFDEILTLTQINLMKNEMSYMCRYDTANGGIQYELAKDKQNTMHDDRSYTAAMAAFALASMRRMDLVNKPKDDFDLSAFTSISRAPQVYGNRERR